MELLSRKQAKELKIRHYYTGKLCIRGHISNRLTSTGQCCECVRENHYTYYENNRDQALLGIKKWATRNNDKVVAASRRYRANNPEADSINHKKWYRLHTGQHHLYAKWWRSINKSKLQHYNAVRRAALKQAIPKWATMVSIHNIYEMSCEQSLETNIKHHVDHIIPLQHPLVCGLHVVDNLQVIPAVDNLSKSNKLIV